MLATGISFDQTWVAGYLIVCVCDHLGFCPFGIVFSGAVGDTLYYTYFFYLKFMNDHEITLREIKSATTFHVAVHQHRMYATYT